MKVVQQGPKGFICECDGVGLTYIIVLNCLCSLPRGRALAAGYPEVRLCGGHWSDWSVQLGRARERRVLGGVLLLARLV